MKDRTPSLGRAQRESRPGAPIQYVIDVSIERVRINGEQADCQLAADMFADCIQRALESLAAPDSLSDSEGAC